MTIVAYASAENWNTLAKYLNGKSMGFKKMALITISTSPGDGEREKSEFRVSFFCGPLEPDLSET